MDKVLQDILRDIPEAYLSTKAELETIFETEIKDLR
jgi:hypothetical protein